MTGQKWEYRVVKMATLARLSDAIMNEHEWELVAVSRDNSDWYAFFKRPLVDDGSQTLT